MINNKGGKELFLPPLLFFHALRPAGLLATPLIHFSRWQRRAWVWHMGVETQDFASFFSPLSRL